VHLLLLRGGFRRRGGSAEGSAEGFGGGSAEGRSGGGSSGEGERSNAIGRKRSGYS